MAIGDRSAPRRRDDTRLALLFILPAGIGLVVFYFWPLLRGIGLSFTSWDLLSPASFIGLDNYQRMIEDPVFWNAVRVTIVYVVINIGVQTAVALLIAVLMQRLARSLVLRAVILAPYLVSNVVAGRPGLSVDSRLPARRRKPGTDVAGPRPHRLSHQ